MMRWLRFENAVGGESLGKAGEKNNTFRQQQQQLVVVGFFLLLFCMQEKSGVVFRKE